MHTANTVDVGLQFNYHRCWRLSSLARNDEPHFDHNSQSRLKMPLSLNLLNV